MATHLASDGYIDRYSFTPAGVDISKRRKRMKKEQAEEWAYAFEMLKFLKGEGYDARKALRATYDSCTEVHHPGEHTCTKHPTEERCPQQVKGFREILVEMYQTHLDKNQDYSSANILGMGEIGLATRLWDKVVRYVSLMGFRIEAKLVAFEAPREPKNESIEDTLKDIAVYGVIGRLLRKGVWGK